MRMAVFEVRSALCSKHPVMLKQTIRRITTTSSPHWLERVLSPTLFLSCYPSMMMMMMLLLLLLLLLMMMMMIAMVMMMIMMMIMIMVMTMAISRVFGDYSDMKVTTTMMMVMVVVVVVVMTVDTVFAFIAVVVANAVHGVPLKEWRSTGWAATFTGPILCTTLLRWRDWTDPTGRC